MAGDPVMDGSPDSDGKSAGLSNRGGSISKMIGVGTCTSAANSCMRSAWYSVARARLECISHHGRFQSQHYHLCIQRTCQLEGVEHVMRTIASYRLLTSSQASHCRPHLANICLSVLLAHLRPAAVLNCSANTDRQCTGCLNPPEAALF